MITRKRNWLSLPAGLIWAMTRDADLTEKVQTDPGAHSNIGLGIAIRLACKKVSARYFDDAKEAWLALRDLIADEKIRAEGSLIERRGLGLHAALVTEYPNTPIPSGEAGNLILLDYWGGFTETVLGPDKLYRFHNGQDRYWKDVRLLAENLFTAFPPNRRGKKTDLMGSIGDGGEVTDQVLVVASCAKKGGNLKRKPSYQHVKIEEAFDAELANGTKIEVLLNLRPVEFKKRLSDRMKHMGYLKESDIPEETSFRRSLTRLKSERLPGRNGKSR